MFFKFMINMLQSNNKHFFLKKNINNITRMKLNLRFIKITKMEVRLLKAQESKLNKLQNIVTKIVF